MAENLLISEYSNIFGLFGHFGFRAISEKNLGQKVFSLLGKNRDGTSPLFFSSPSQAFGLNAEPVQAWAGKKNLEPDFCLRLKLIKTVIT